MVQPNSGMDQPLVKVPGGTSGRSPHVLPYLMGLKIATGVEKIYSLAEQIGHAISLANLLKRIGTGEQYWAEVNHTE